MSRKEKQNKPGKTSFTGTKSNCLIFVTDLIGVVLVGLGVAFDLVIALDINFDILSLGFDSLINVLALVSSFLIPRRNERTREKYSLSLDDIDYLESNGSGVYINLFVVSIALILADAFLYVFSMSWSLIFALMAELMFVSVFVGPAVADYAGGDKSIIKHAINKFIQLADPSDGPHYISIYDFYVTYNSSDEAKQVDRILGSILINSDVAFIYRLLYKRFKTSDEEQNNILSANINKYFLYLISEYLDNMPEAISSYIKTSQQVHLILTNIKFLRSGIDNYFYEEFDKLESYIYFSKSIYRIGTITKKYPDFAKNFDEVKDIVSELNNNNYQSSHEDEFTINQSYLIALDNMLLHSIKECQVWFVDISSSAALKKFSSEKPHYYLLFIVFYFAYLNIDEEYMSEGTKKERNKYLQTFVSFIQKRYPENFDYIIQNVNSSDFINLLSYFKECYEYSVLVLPSDATALSITRYDRNNEFQFWFILLLLKIIEDRAFYDELERVLSDELRKQIHEYCQSFLEDTSKYTPLINSIAKLIYEDDCAYTLDNYLEAINNIMNYDNRKKEYQKLMENKDIDSLVRDLNNELSKDEDFIEDKDLPTGGEIKETDIQYIYCHDDSAVSILKESCSFPSKAEVLHSVFDIVKSNYKEKQIVKKISSYSPTIINEINSFKPDYAFITNRDNRHYSVDKLKPILREIKEPHKYFNNLTLTTHDVFYKKGAIKFYIKISIGENNMRPAGESDYQILCDYFEYGEKFDEFYSIKKEDVLNSTSVLTLHVHYYYEFDFTKMLIYKISFFDFHSSDNDEEYSLIEDDDDTSFFESGFDMDLGDDDD